ncbi:MAG TPA: lipid II flippase MurJ [Ramlibacter sp.]|jgi:peptidoglycan biosynthesis protein MviN/MurJ (putative lipid II flippase)|nr:lipid II flippase MurJ [Ramlibacter sp.]
MFLKAGALALALLLASRLLGLVRESVQAAAFGASGLADIVVLMLTLPDWLAGLVASGALAYVLLPAWAHEDAGRIAATQRRVGRILLVTGGVLGLLLVLLHGPAVEWLAGGLPAQLRPQAGVALFWSAVALPLALLAALGVTRLQHERDLIGMYGANLVVNVLLIAALGAAAFAAPGPALAWVGAGLLLAMLARLLWLLHRQRPFRRAPGLADTDTLPPAALWWWAAAAAGLPLALPFVARSLASQDGPGALAVFNYAWKLVELPLVLALQLVGTLALGPISQALRSADGDRAATDTLRRGFALAWTLACAAVAGLLLASPAVAQLLFGWGRMQPEALEQVARWGRIGSWSLLPQALVTIAVAVLAARERMRVAVIAYGVALLVLLIAPARDGAALMVWLDVLWVAIALAVLRALGPALKSWLPWRALAAPGVLLLMLQALVSVAGVPASHALQWLAAAAAAAAMVGAGWLASGDLRSALRR